MPNVLISELDASPALIGTDLLFVQHAAGPPAEYCTMTQVATFAGGSSGGANLQTFSTTGANTWSKPSSGALAVIELWGAGGGGGMMATGYGSGGGGGGYVQINVLLSSLASSVVATIGAGGASQTVNASNGNAGAVTSFGTYISCYGGRGGVVSASGVQSPGGGAGGPQDVWTTSTNINGVSSYIAISSAGQTTGQTATTGAIFNSSAGWGCSSATSVNISAAPCLNGGAGGAGHATTAGTSISGIGGISLNGGAGGNGLATGAGIPGTSPGGGGGSGSTQGGAGGNGQIRITVY